MTEPTPAPAPVPDAAPAAPEVVAPLPQSKVGRADAVVEGALTQLAPYAPTVKPGVKTSEFVVTFLTVASGLVGTFLHKQLDVSANITLALDILSAVLTVAYIAARTALKFGVAKKAAQRVLSIESDLQK